MPKEPSRYSKNAYSVVGATLGDLSRSLKTRRDDEVIVVYRDFRNWLAGVPSRSNAAGVRCPRLVVLAEFRLLPFRDLQQAWRMESEQRQEL